jgi:hypothetical protein
MIMVGSTPGRTSQTVIRYLNFDFDFSDAMDTTTTEETVLITEHELALIDWGYCSLLGNY